ncbi:MAG: glucoamylase family protein, partial [Methylotenera sp.]
FTKLFAGESGIDPYTREVSDVYQDVFGEGTFIGKGIYDVNAFRQSVDGRFPENLILSHDLLESAYARSALVTDVDFVEEFPASYTIDASRRHRWIRGDWQLAGWLLPRVPMASKSCEPSESNRIQNNREQNPLTALSVWKIFDNLRRSLVPPSLLVVLLGGWLFAAGPAWLWTLLVLTIVFLPSMLGSSFEFIRKPKERDWLVHLMATGKSAYHSMQVSALTIVLLPYDTLICLDAIMCSGLRMLFTKRGLLMWHMPSYVSRNARSTLPDFFREMWVAPVLAVTLSLVLAFSFNASQSVEFFTCVPVLLLWLLSPVIAWWISKPFAPLVADLSDKQQVFLRTTARRTWRFFAEFVSPQDNWLPPDNFQEYPIPVIASRTSPTNIGMALLANLTAYDFGYITAGELLQLTENTLASMEKLERYHGHFYNWYDTRTLSPLYPQYVSTVDSGNLAGSLLTLQAGLLELKNQPVLSVNACQGLHDTLLVFSEHAAVETDTKLTEKIKLIKEMLQSLTNFKYSTDAYSKELTETSRLLVEIRSSGEALLSLLPLDIDSNSEPHYWINSFNQQCQMILDDIKFLVFMPHHYNNIPTLLELATDKISGIENLWVVGAAATVSSNGNAIDRLSIIDDLVARCHAFAVMDFEFLYDTSCGLLTIGYDVSERRRDVSCYDLLASEARLASYLVIAQGQVPQKHWFSLGRLLTSYGGDVSLISWSGSMFEYLMPQLMMPSYPNTLLDQTSKAVVMRQIDYGRQRGVPWGISESCYSATDMHQVYQYRAFGVPGLGFKRGLGDDLVIAPYASALALTVMPEEACSNLELLAAQNFLGAYGFYEAIDYTPSRVPRGKSNAIVRTYMAHHQGMSFLAF